MWKRKECNNQSEKLVSWLVQLGGSLSPSLFLHHDEDYTAGMYDRHLHSYCNVSFAVNKIRISGVRVKVVVTLTLTV